MPRITISYRREDSEEITGRIYDRLVGHYGEQMVFRDIDDIPLGVDYRTHISNILDESDILLAIVGPRWLGPRASRSRIDDTGDLVRIEVESALRKGMPLIPVLVMRTKPLTLKQLPASLHEFTYRNALRVDSGADFHTHMAKLIRSMDQILAGAQTEHEPPAELADEPDPHDDVTPTDAEVASLRENNRILEERSNTACRLYEEVSATLLNSEQEVRSLSAQLTAARDTLVAHRREGAAALAEIRAELAKRDAEIQRLRGETIDPRRLPILQSKEEAIAQNQTEIRRKNIEIEKLKKQLAGSNSAKQAGISAFYYQLALAALVPALLVMIWLVVNGGTLKSQPGDQKGPANAATSPPAPSAAVQPQPSAISQPVKIPDVPPIPKFQDIPVISPPPKLVLPSEIPELQQPIAPLPAPPSRH